MDCSFFVSCGDVILWIHSNSVWVRKPILLKIIFWWWRQIVAVDYPPLLLLLQKLCHHEFYISLIRLQFATQYYHRTNYGKVQCIIMISFFDRQNKIHLTCMARVLHDSSCQIFLSWGRHKISFPLLYSSFSPSLSIHNCQCHTQNGKQNTVIIKVFIYISTLKYL